MNNGELTFEAFRNEGVCYINLQGSLTLAGCDPFFEAVCRIIVDEDQKLVLGLSRLDFVDSAGLGTLMRINGKLKRGKRELVFVEPSTQVYKLLTMAKVDLVIPVETGMEGQRVRQELEHPEYRVASEHDNGAIEGGSALAA